MNWEALRDSLIEDNFIPKLFEGFSRLPSWVKNTMLQVIKYWIACDWDQLDAHLLSSGIFQKIFEMISTLPSPKSMLFCTSMSIISQITSREDSTLWTQILTQFSSHFTTPTVWTLIFPLYVATNSSVTLEDLLSTCPSPSNPEDDSVTKKFLVPKSKSKVKSKRKRERINSYTKFEKQKQESMAVSRKRFKSGQDMEIEVDLEDGRNRFRLDLNRCDDRGNERDREGWGLEE